MPKMKTRRCAAKRFSTTGTGKFNRRRQNLRHPHQEGCQAQDAFGPGRFGGCHQREGCSSDDALRLSVADCIPFSALGWHDLRLAGFPISIGG